MDLPKLVLEGVSKARVDVDVNRLNSLSIRLNTLVERIRRQAFLPSVGKESPVFGLPQLASLCKLSPTSMTRRLEKAETDGSGLPLGSISTQKNQMGAPSSDEANASESPESNGHPTVASHKGRRQWTLSEARQWVQVCNPPFKRPHGVKAAVLTVANFKGGVGKTMTAMSLSQGLSLMGYKVLAIDVDPQASLTGLFGLMPIDIDEMQTILPILLPPTHDNYRASLKESIQKTYWDGLDLIAGAREIFAGEFWLPRRQLEKDQDVKNFSFFSVLDMSLDIDLRDEYDYIIIDTMPSLSYITINTLMAADALIMPLPPEGLDIYSSAQYWDMYLELMSAIPDPKKYKFVGILPSKVDHAKGHTKDLLKWIQAGYEELMLTAEIPVTQVVSVGAAEMATVFDITKYVGSSRTYVRAREAYDNLVAEIDSLTRSTCWKVKE